MFQGELVLLEQPDGPFPTADWNLPWEEHVLARGPDVMFEVADLDEEDDTIEVRKSPRGLTLLLVSSIVIASLPE